MMKGMERRGDWEGFRGDWKVADSANVVSEEDQAPSYDAKDVWSMWSKEFVERVSMSEKVESVVALGSVLAISLVDANAGKWKSIF
jgi:dethiobiotin synthetase/adenosylmethionine--8-amino-7-oxononanoate aminotransferase